MQPKVRILRRRILISFIDLPEEKKIVFCVVCWGFCVFGAWSRMCATCSPRRTANALNPGSRFEFRAGAALRTRASWSHFERSLVNILSGRMWFYGGFWWTEVNGPGRKWHDGLGSLGCKVLGLDREMSELRHRVERGKRLGCYDLASVASLAGLQVSSCSFGWNYFLSVLIAWRSVE